MQCPGLKFNPMMLLHGEQYLRLSGGSLASSGTVTNNAKISGVYDKGKVNCVTTLQGHCFEQVLITVDTMMQGVVLICDTSSVNAAGEEVAFSRSSVFIRGIGGYGGDRCATV